MSVQSASFQLATYRFPEIHLQFPYEVDTKTEVSIAIDPKGIYRPAEQAYVLRMRCGLINTDTQEAWVDVLCEAVFTFSQELALEEIPPFFYPNSVAIVFPYLRAMVSTLSLQANLGTPIILPTMNLTSLQEQLKTATVVE